VPPMSAARTRPELTDEASRATVSLVPTAPSAAP
jgi:hypothetical protein